MVWYGMVWYGIVEFNVPLDTVQVILETTTLSSNEHLPYTTLFHQIQIMIAGMVWYGILEFNVPLDTV